MRDPLVKPRCRSCHAETSKKKKARQNKFEDPRQRSEKKRRRATFFQECEIPESSPDVGVVTRKRAKKEEKKGVKKRGGGYLSPRMRDPRVKPRCRGCHAETSKKKKECQNKFEDPHRNPFQNFRVANFL
ncbi:hypothetical protein CDAR_596391 [Caerostris darwini]|uniref:Uncharacterized protein n=1 Tax=Caerostris darwini TaxID=1538125 RepID=A0AAV4TVF2_9ARAC|nr:hypothetical protein CDAR_596391 [Caerostris darwini]